VHTQQSSSEPVEEVAAPVEPVVPWRIEVEPGIVFEFFERHGQCIVPCWVYQAECGFDIVAKKPEPLYGGLASKVKIDLRLAPILGGDLLHTIESTLRTEVGFDPAVDTRELILPLLTTAVHKARWTARSYPDWWLRQQETAVARRRARVYGPTLGEYVEAVATHESAYAATFT
jgi:hypothetical protein